MTTLETVTFAVESFTWDAGAFTVVGDWGPGAEGRPRLLVEVAGRTRNVGAQGGRTAGGAGWRATFICAGVPDAGAQAALKLGEETVAIGAPELAPVPDVPGEALSLIEQIRAERAALDRARHALARERKAAEEAEARLVAVRRGSRETAPDAPEWLGYAVFAAVAFVFLLVLTWVL